MSIEQDNQGDIAKMALEVRLRESAAKKGWNQAELARRAGLDRQLISSYWHGKTRPSRDNLIALADALEIDPRWLVGGVNGTASRLLDQIDKLIEAGDDDAVNALRADLEGIAHDPDLEDALQNRADFILSMMGDMSARARRGTFITKWEEKRANARKTIAEALENAERITGFDLGEGLRTALLSLSGQLILTKLEDVSLDLLSWPYETLIESMVARVRSGEVAIMDEQATLHSTKPNYRGED